MAREESISSELPGNIDLFVNSNRNSWDTTDAVPANARLCEIRRPWNELFQAFVLALVFN